MIVLDENLLGLRLDNTELRPNTIIKDEAVARLLRGFKGATFVTTNVTDFWRRIPAHPHYGIVCVSLPNERLREVSTLLRRLLRVPEFRTKAARMGKVVRVSRQQIHYYVADANRVHVLTWPS